MSRFGFRFGRQHRRHGEGRCPHHGQLAGDLSLLSCPLRTEVRVSRLHCHHACGQRLRELGIVEGSRLCVLRRSDPLVLMVKDVRIAVDPLTAGLVEIEEP